jgi:hypothetical protein
MFYRNVAPETLGVTTCIARELGLKFDIQCIGHSPCALTEAMQPIDQRASTIGAQWAEYLTRKSKGMVYSVPHLTPVGRVVQKTEATIALAIPHTPWVPQRAESMARLRKQLGITNDVRAWGGANHEPTHGYREFSDREPNTVWAEKLWRWLVSTDADWCLQLQDDVTVAPNFWPALRAMLAALPPEAGIVGLTSVHPMANEVARRGHRWYRTPSQLVGWAYAVRRPVLEQFLVWREQPGVQELNEDEQIANFAAQSGLGVWHPVPAICDHDTTIQSSYHNDAHAMRRPQVTWRGYQAGDIESVEWWKPGGAVETLQTPPQRVCWFCLQRPIIAQSVRSGAGICGQCLMTSMTNVIAPAIEHSERGWKP